MLLAWLDSWSGLGSIVVGMQRHGYDLTLRSLSIGMRQSVVEFSE